MKVEITEQYLDNELKRMVRAGEVLNVSKERADVLCGNNGYGHAFGRKLEEDVKKVEEEIETEVVKPVEKAVKKITKKAKK
jgi:hypothetical protein